MLFRKKLIADPVGKHYFFYFLHLAIKCPELIYQVRKANQDNFKIMYL